MPASQDASSPSSASRSPTPSRRSATPSSSSLGHPCAFCGYVAPTLVDAAHHLQNPHKFDVSAVLALGTSDAIERVLVRLRALGCPRCDFVARNQKEFRNHLKGKKKNSHRIVTSDVGWLAGLAGPSTASFVDHRHLTAPSSIPEGMTAPGTPSAQLGPDGHVFTPADVGADAAAQPSSSHKKRRVRAETVSGSSGEAGSCACHHLLASSEDITALTDADLRKLRNRLAAAAARDGSPVPRCCVSTLLEYIRRLEGAPNSSNSFLLPRRDDCSCLVARLGLSLHSVKAGDWLPAVDAVLGRLSAGKPVGDCCLLTLDARLKILEYDAKSRLQSMTPNESCDCPRLLSLDELAAIPQEELLGSAVGFPFRTPSDTCKRYCIVQRQAELIRRIESNKTDPEKSLTATVSASVRPSGLNCVICLETYDDPHVVACGHSFCFECLRLWLANSKACPICNARVPDRPARNWVLAGQVDAVLEAGHAVPGSRKARKKSDAEISRIWDALFPRRDPRAFAFQDNDDRVTRCGQCNWEVVDNVCVNCGHVYDDEGGPAEASSASGASAQGDSGDDVLFDDDSEAEVDGDDDDDDDDEEDDDDDEEASGSASGHNDDDDDDNDSFVVADDEGLSEHSDSDAAAGGAGSSDDDDDDDDNDGSGRAARRRRRQQPAMSAPAAATRKRRRVAATSDEGEGEEGREGGDREGESSRASRRRRGAPSARRRRRRVLSSDGGDDDDDDE
ncbi:E3 ubiquitin ligase [Cladochytrium tenue]|nr:E3 ubiquitin ligase [Cladochytrium tenue]